MRSFVLLFAFIGPLATAHATTLMPLDLSGLTQRAEAVFAGHVLSTRATWTADHQAIYTEATIRIERVLAGGLVAGQSVLVRREGGTVDGVGMKVFGAASFDKDDDVVLFIEQRRGNNYVVGMAQGKLAVHRDAAGVQHLSRDLSEVAYTRAVRPSERELSTTAKTAPIVTVDELAVEVARLKREAKRP